MILMTVPCHSVLPQSDLHRGVYFVNKEKGTLEKNTMLHVVPRSGLNDVNGSFPGSASSTPGFTDNVATRLRIVIHPGVALEYGKGS